MISQFTDSGMGYKPPKPKPEDDPNNPETRQFNQGQTFAQMQQSGQARPAPPTPIGNGAEFAPQGSMVNSVQAPPMNAPNAIPQGQAPSNYTVPQSAGGGMEQQLKDAYGGYKGYGQFQAPQIGQNPFSDPTQGGQFSGALQSSIMGGLNNPSRYDNPALQDAFKQFSGQIDDQYNGLDQNLRSSIASRGLGSIGDSSIGTADQRFQNLQRRSAKSDMASNLLNQQAQTYGQDRASMLSAAMGYGQNQFGNALNTWGANNQQGNQNFNNQLAAYQANQGANQQNFGQQQQLLNNLLGYGQQSFSNQLATNQQNNNQQQQYMDWLLKMQGGV